MNSLNHFANKGMNRAVQVLLDHPQIEELLTFKDNNAKHTKDSKNNGSWIALQAALNTVLIPRARIQTAKLLLLKSDPETVFQTAKAEVSSMYEALSSLEFGTPVNSVPLNGLLLFPNQCRFYGSDRLVKRFKYVSRQDEATKVNVLAFICRYLPNSDSWLSKKMNAFFSSVDKLQLRAKGLSTNQTYYRVLEYQFPLRHATGTKFLQTCLFLSKSLGRVDLFDNEVIKLIIDNAWFTYGRSYHIAYSIIYCALLGLSTLLNYTFHEWIIVDDSASGALTIVIVVVVINTYFVLLEISRIIEVARGYGIYYYVMDPQNSVDWVTFIGVYAGNIIRLTTREESGFSSGILAVATIFLWLRFLYLLRPFKATGPLVRMLFHIMLKIKELVLIMIVFIFAFSQSLYLLSYSDSTLDFSGRSGSIMHSFLFMMGQIDISQMTSSSNPDLAQLLLCLFIFANTIILLNLLIALMNNGYDDIQQLATAEYYNSKAEIMAEQFRTAEVRGEKYQYYLVREDDRSRSEPPPIDDVPCKDSVKGQSEDSSLKSVLLELQLSNDSLRKDLTEVLSLLKNKHNSGRYVV
jgi:hypothetical protein